MSLRIASLALVLCTAPVALLLGSCGEEDLTGHGCGIPGAPADCGQTCMTDRDCVVGSYCGGDNLCTADCVQSGAAVCKEGDTCDGNGRCANVTDGGPISCTGLACKVNHECAGGAKTTISGKVFAPNGTLPLYNAAVFVPNAPVEPIAEGVTCDRCNGKLSGDPVTFTATGSDGSFALLDVPTGKDIPLVIQLGRWRRQVTIPAVTDCATQPLDAVTTRLPKNAAEGSIPKMAIASGNADHFECLLLKIGIDPAEITLPSGAGRIHFFRGTDDDGLDLMPSAPTADTLYGSLANMLKYDVLLLPCEGKEFNKGRFNNMTLTPDPRTLLSAYLDAGGRVFATHYSYDWLTYPMSPYNKIAMPAAMNGQWPVGQIDDYNNTIHALLVTTFPKGMDFAKWLISAGATSMPNQLDIAEGRSDVIGVNPTYAQPWATYNFNYVTNNGKTGGPAVMHFTFNTPLDAPKDDKGVPQSCGRVVFSDFHVTAGAVTMGQNIFPTACKMDPMTDQEKALAFMLFDLSSCVQQDISPPIL